MRMHYVSGSRADFGLMARSLVWLQDQGAFDLSVVVTGQHLAPGYGDTRNDIVQSGLKIAGDIPVAISGTDGLEMGRALATEMLGFLDLWSKDRPDLVLVLGDRGEMVAAALAAVHLGIHVAHLHGGELSGTLDESFRHVLTKLSHFHFVANSDAASRIARMGERDENIWVVGAPGLVGLTDGVKRRDGGFQRTFGLDPNASHTALVVFHPVVQEASDAGLQMRAVLDVLVRKGCAALILRPNSDAGGAQIDAVLDSLAYTNRIVVRTHLDRVDYLQAMADADVVIGNSSSGIIESASFGTPCLNLGTRQNGRLRNDNTVDCSSFAIDALEVGLDQALSLTGPFANRYGDGRTHERLADVLSSLILSDTILAKANAY